MSDGYQILGDLLGADATEVLGFDFASLFSAAGGLAQGAADWKAEKDKTDAAEKTSREAGNAAVSADIRATEARRLMLLAELTKAPNLAASEAAWKLAAEAQDRAAEGLSADNQKRRADAARKALEDETSKWRKAAGDPNKTKVAEAAVKAAKETYNKTQNALVVRQGQTPSLPTGPSESWLTRPVLGSVPGWGVVAGGMGLAAALGTIIAIVARR